MSRRSRSARSYGHGVGLSYRRNEFVSRGQSVAGYPGHGPNRAPKPAPTSRSDVNMNPCGALSRKYLPPTEPHRRRPVDIQLCPTREPMQWTVQPSPRTAHGSRSCAHDRSWTFLVRPRSSRTAQRTPDALAHHARRRAEDAHSTSRSRISSKAWKESAMELPSLGSRCTDSWKNLYGFYFAGSAGFSAASFARSICSIAARISSNLRFDPCTETMIRSPTKTSILPCRLDLMYSSRAFQFL